MITTFKNINPSVLCDLLVSKNIFSKITSDLREGNIAENVWVESEQEIILTDYELDKIQQIDICHEEKPKSLEEQVQDLQKEKEHLWETVQFLLKKTGMIGDEKDATN